VGRSCQTALSRRAKLRKPGNGFQFQSRRSSRQVYASVATLTCLGPSSIDPQPLFVGQAPRLRPYLRLRRGFFISAAAFGMPRRDSAVAVHAFFPVSACLAAKTANGLGGESRRACQGRPHSAHGFATRPKRPCEIEAPAVQASREASEREASEREASERQGEDQRRLLARKPARVETSSRARHAGPGRRGRRSPPSILERMGIFARFRF
jgi:hypothetical protein